MPVTPQRIQVTDGQRQIEITDPSQVIDNLIDSIPAFIWTSGPNKECTYFNRAWLDYRGRKLEEELIDGFTFGIHPDDVDQTVKSYLKAFDNRTLYEAEYRIKNAENEYHWVMDRGMPVYGKEGTDFLGFAGLCMNIDAQKRLEGQLKDSHQQLAEQNASLRLINQLSNLLQNCTTLDTMIDETLYAMGAITSPDIALVNVQIPATDSLPATEVSRQMGMDGNKLNASSFEGLMDPNHNRWQIYRCGSVQECNQMPMRNRTALLAAGINACILTPLFYQEQYLGFIALGFRHTRAFTLLENQTYDSIGKTLSIALTNTASRRELEHRAEHDVLTGLGNRSLLHKEFKKGLDKHSVAAIMLIDLDRFKDINDTLGHHMGDKVLRQIHPQIKPLLDEHKATMYRLGGDEFTVVVYDKKNPDKIYQLAIDLRDKLREPIRVERLKVEIDASIGIATFPSDGKDSHELLKCADMAMYQAKSSGRGILMYREEMNKYTPERFAIMADLSQSIRNRELQVHFQPKFDYSEDTITGFEALVRWQHPTLGLLYPDTFMPLAEVSDVIHQLTREVLELSLKHQQQWREQGYCFSVSVNLSARNLLDERLLDTLKDLIARYESDPAKIELEITETALMQDPDAAADLLRKIAELGIKLSIDDFGTGYSSLAYLKRLPIHNLKIDKVFVSEMLSDEQDETIVKSTITLAHNLNLQVVAEGIEDAATLERLKEMGCDIAQGYHIARPMAWSDVEQQVIPNIKKCVA
jgi:diguanylate cyclase (GGDEF)-like protein